MHWQKLDREHTIKVIKSVQSPENQGMIAQGTSEVKRAKARFYEDHDIYRVTNFASLPSFTFEFISDGTFYHYLDGTEHAIYTVNDKGALRLEEHNVLDYLEFFFQYVSQDDEDAVLIVNPRDMPLLDSLDADAYDAVFNHHKPPTVKTLSDDDFQIEADIYLESHMVRATINVTTKGRVTITKQQSSMQTVMKSPAETSYL